MYTLYRASTSPLPPEVAAVVGAPMNARRRQGVLVATVAVALIMALSSVLSFPVVNSSSSLPLSSGVSPHPVGVPAALPPTSPLSAAGPQNGPAAPSSPSATYPWLPTLAPSSQGSPLPPGAPVPLPPSGMSPRQFYAAWAGSNPSYGSSGNNSTGASPCYNLWAAIEYTCGWHDEPSISGYSNLPGSGGNVTWNITLPVDRSPTQNQSDIYTAIWFGMTLNDPYAWMHQCFLELQFYPDSNWIANHRVHENGFWTGAAVAWQIQQSNGHEDACFHQPLMSTAGNHFVMQQGDPITVTMNGWQTSPYGENITVVDHNENTTAGTSFVNMYNHALNYPIDPSYSENDVPNALLWTPGGEPPVSFAFENAHDYGMPRNATFGGCAPGFSTLEAAAKISLTNSINGAVPCPSYNPNSWAQDTLHPWHISPPVFYNAHARETASQIQFGQDFGGILMASTVSHGTCVGDIGSNWCSYPWYSYDGGSNTFTFGATEYYGATQDFGAYNQYSSTWSADAAGLLYYPTNNFSVPGGTHHLTINVAGTGSVHFLNYTLNGPTTRTFTGLRPGPYSLNAVAATGEYFDTWAGSSGAVLDPASTPWTSVNLTGNASISATFSPSPPANVRTMFATVGGSINVVPGFMFRPVQIYSGYVGAINFDSRVVHPSTTVTNGQTLSLAPGMYSLEAYPDPGSGFAGWSVSGGAHVAAPFFPITWVNIKGTTSNVTITATYQSSASVANVEFLGVPSFGGTVELNGTPVAFGVPYHLAVGSYNLTATPAGGFTFATWLYVWSAMMSNFSANTRFSVETGYSTVAVLFNHTPTVTLDASPAAGGQVIFNGTAVPPGGSFSAVQSLPQTGDGIYSIGAAVSPGYTFVGWSVNNSSRAQVTNVSSVRTTVLVNRTVTLVADFATVSSQSFLTVDEIGHGIVRFNGTMSTSTRTMYGPLARGQYLIAEHPSAGSMFMGWNVSGDVSVAKLYVIQSVQMGKLDVYVPTFSATVWGNGTLTADFAPLEYPVTFVDSPSVTGGVAIVNGTPVYGGQTIELAPGAYSLSIEGGTGTGVTWFTTSNLTVASAQAPSTYLVVAGSGSLYALYISRPEILAGEIRANSFNASSTGFSVTVFGGTEPFAFSATSQVGACTTSGPTATIENTTTVYCHPSIGGTIQIHVTVTDALGYVAQGNATFALTSRVIATPPSGLTSGTITTFAEELNATPTSSLSGVATLYVASSAGTVLGEYAVVIVQGFGSTALIPGMLLPVGMTSLSYWTMSGGVRSAPGTLSFSSSTPPTTLTLSASSSSPVAGQPVTFTVTSNGRGGSVMLYAHTSGGTLVAAFSVSLNAAGTGSIVLMPTVLGPTTVWQAVYGTVVSNSVTVTSHGSSVSAAGETGLTGRWRVSLPTVERVSVG